MHNSNYIQYNKIGDLASSGVSTGASAARVFATGGLDIGADITLALSIFSFGGDLINQWTSHPAADARDFIKNAKPKIAILDPYERLKSVIVYSQKINPKAIDVNAREWILWYKQNYPNDYLKLPPASKNYWNSYIISLEQSYNNPNNMNANLDKAMFTNQEINANASLFEKASNLLKSGTTADGTPSKTNWVLYGAIALGVILLLKRK